MKKLLRVVATIIIIALVAGCGMSKKDVGDAVKTSIQETLVSDPDFQEYKMAVTSVQVFKKGGNIYKGLASIMHEGKSHNVTVEIIVDGDNVMWEAAPGSFMFLAQKEFENLGEELYNTADLSNSAVQCAKNLRQIGLGLLMYYNENNGSFPTSLDQLYYNYASEKDNLICPLDDTPEKIGKDLMTSYEYTSPDKSTSQTILAYDRNPHVYGNIERNVLFADGHIEVISEEDFKKMK